MSFTIETLNASAMQAYQILADAGQHTKKGVLAIGEEGSRILHDIYSLDGLLSLTKALIADLRFLSLIPKLSGLFANLLPVLENQKAFYYATLCFRSVVECTKTDPATGHISLQLPQMHDGSGIDYMKLCYVIGGFFDTGKFLKKLEIYEFSAFSQVATHLAGVQLFSYQEKNWTFGDLPMLNRFCDSPKEVFFWVAAGIDVWRWINKLSVGTEEERAKQLEWNRILGVTSSAARMITLGLYRQHAKAWWLLTIDFIGQNAGLFKFIVTRYNIHQEHLNPL